MQEGNSALHVMIKSPTHDAMKEIAEEERRSLGVQVDIFLTHQIALHRRRGKRAARAADRGTAQR
jgi:hypothetical protein